MGAKEKVVFLLEVCRYMHLNPVRARVVTSVSDDARAWDSVLRQQIYLGGEDFVARMHALVRPRNSTESDIPKVQRRKVRTTGPMAQIGRQPRGGAVLGVHARRPDHDGNRT